MTSKVLQPEGWPRPRGYANGVAATGRQLFLAGQIGWDASQRLVPGGLVPQAEQALRNIVAVLAADGATPEHLVRLTWYVTDRASYLAAAGPLGEAYRRVIGRHPLRVLADAAHQHPGEQEIRKHDHTAEAEAHHMA